MRLLVHLKFLCGLTSNDKHPEILVRPTGNNDELDFRFRQKARKHSCLAQPKKNLDCHESNVHKTFDLVIEMIVHWELASCLRFELQRSKAFRKGFILWLLHDLEDNERFYCKDYTLNQRNIVTRRRHSDAWINDVSLDGKADNDTKVDKNRISMTIIALSPPQLRNLEAELKWSSLLMPLVHQKFCLEYILACLSTLGGAYSSLGEWSTNHAKIAGNISLKQLTVASKLGNPLLASHCRLYHAHSLIQTGKFRSAAHIIRHEYTIAISSLGKYDPKLLVCCKAARARLLYIQKRQAKTAKS